MDEIVTPHEAQIETLLQILACLLDRLGGEVVISRADFEAYQDAPVVGRHLTRDYVVIRLAYEDEEGDVSLNLPEDLPQP
jgi:hypothetical protein